MTLRSVEDAHGQNRECEFLSAASTSDTAMRELEILQEVELERVPHGEDEFAFASHLMRFGMPPYHVHLEECKSEPIPSLDFERIPARALI